MTTFADPTELFPGSTHDISGLENISLGVADELHFGPVPHNRYLVDSQRDSQTGEWKMVYGDMSDGEDMLLYLLFQQPDLEPLQRFIPAKEVLDLVRGAREESGVSYIDEDGTRRTKFYCKDMLQALAEPLLKYIV